MPEKIRGFRETYIKKGYNRSAMEQIKKRKGLPVRLFFMLIKLGILLVILALGLNLFVVKSTEEKIAASLDSHEDTLQKAEVEDLCNVKAECIMVLGASVHADGTPSPMLRDRLDTAIALYEAGAAPKLLFSGDDGQVSYNEVNAMMNYAMDAGVPKKAIFLDHAGFSTYESAYRAKSVFEVERMIVVTQEYHLYRALYGCERVGIEAVGVAANQQRYRGQFYRDVREVLARDKDCIKWIFKPQPTFLGEAIPISGSGIETH